MLEEGNGDGFLMLAVDREANLLRSPPRVVKVGVLPPFSNGFGIKVVLCPSSLTEACDRSIAALMACVAEALPCSICPIGPIGSGIRMADSPSLRD
jgi:hypothetical protein